MKFSFAFVISMILTPVLFGCTHSAPVRPGPVESIPMEEYTQLVERHTRHTNQYSGLYQTFQADVTILDAEMQMAVLRQRASDQGWDQKLFQSEREKMIQEQSAYAKYFMRFFAGDRDYDDLAKPKTIWRVYLDIQGTRFTGKVTRLKDKLVELRREYPHMDRFSSPYEISFNVPMSTIEKASSKITLTSSIGNAEFNFEPAH